MFNSSLADNEDDVRSTIGDELHENIFGDLERSSLVSAQSKEWLILH